MTTSVVTAAPETPFRELVGMMAENGISALPVLDRLGCPIGVVSEADITGEADLPGAYGHAGARRWYRTPEWNAAEVMTTPVRAIHASEPVSFAASLLARTDLRRLFVTDWDGRLVGVVSRGDLVRAHLDDGVNAACHVGAVGSTQVRGSPPRDLPRVH